MTVREILAAIFTGARVDVPSCDPIDLRTIPREQWEQYLCYPVLIPEDLARYIAGMNQSATILEKDHIEERIMAFHGVQPPYAIVFRNKVARLMLE